MAIGAYLVETFCFGVQKCYIHLINDDYYDLIEYIRSLCGESKRVTPSYAATLIKKSVEYADNNGFKPHPDYLKARRFLNNIPIDENQKFDFGHDGKPLYMQRSCETNEYASRVMKVLEKNKGAGNYSFM